MNINDVLKSWIDRKGINSTISILSWVESKNKNLVVKVNKIEYSSLLDWKIDTNGVLHNSCNSFFSIKGYKKKLENATYEQPIIIQNEIGYLGIICKKINNTYHFLMQAKIEPGNINKIQISPTIQATKSNFEQKHGGAKPKYLEYFLNAEKYEVVVDQIQSEQSSRFLGKRNRNIIIDIGDNDIEIFDSHMWMTLGQIKELMRINNLVNMDTRTVLSCIPLCFGEINEYSKKNFTDKYLLKSFSNIHYDEYIKIYRKINNIKMFSSSQGKECSLFDLSNWHLYKNEFSCSTEANFKIVFCDLEIEGREVRKWQQPLCEAYGKALFVLFVAKFKDEYKFLVKLKSEIGSFDTVELGPTIQNEYVDTLNMPSNIIERIYLHHIELNKGIKNSVLLSEEGGRFYQEQNENVIIEIEKDEIKELPNNYMWLNYRTLNLLQQSNNVVNIQLRNLISLLDF